MADAKAPKAATPPPVAEWSRNKRFIRTFESDLAAVKTGGKANFTQGSVVQMPVLKAPEDALTRAVAGISSDTIDLDKVPAFDPTRLGAIPESPTEHPAERLVGNSTIADIPALTAEMMPIAPEVKKPPLPESPSPIHTYTSDFNQAVTTTQASPATILAAEQDAKKGKRAVLPTKPKNNNNRYLIIGAVALVVIGVGIAFTAYLYSSGPKTVAVTTPLPVARIFVDQSSAVSGTGVALEQAIEQSVGTSLAANAVRLLSLNNNGATTSESVFSALNLPAPGILLRNIETSGSIAGVINVDDAQSPFFILTVSSYSDTFAGMLDWEPSMESDLSGLFPAYPAPAPVVVPMATSTTATSTTAASAKKVAPTSAVIPASTPVAPIFKDEIVDNHNVRALDDSEGRTLIVYGYWDQYTLIIARNENAFTELITRLSTSHTTQ